MAGDVLMIDESALTGESLPVEKPAGDMGYAGSVIRRGEMNGLVVATGMETFFGNTAGPVTEVKSQSHFEDLVNGFAARGYRTLGWPAPTRREAGA